jgi:hypothetical protein
MILPRGRMNSRGCRCAPVSSPFLKGPIPAKINQGSNNYYFEQQSHTKGEIRKGPSAKAIFNFFVEGHHKNEPQPKNDDEPMTARYNRFTKRVEPVEPIDNGDNEN